jgi:hypothetical protein
MMVVFAAVQIELDGNKRLADVELLTREVEMVIRSKIPHIKKISVMPHSLTSLPLLSDSTTTDRHTFGPLKVRNSYYT